ncbi:mitochondrial ribosomal protein S11 [Tachypleus tridentatus]|uniref:mitochondrial ribosomal protein S11 n=1 Tax=Tachypleus tridentatus TaxID=6853 RepID=UPI003FCF114B
MALIFKNRIMNIFHYCVIYKPQLKLGFRAFQASASICKAEDRKAMMASLPRKDEGVQGEKSVDIDSSKLMKFAFPEENTNDMVVEGTRFAELPICHIHVSPNNTILTISDWKGRPLINRSCGMEGFKNTKKGTNVAAQAAALSLSLIAQERGIKHIRVSVKGLGPGRMSSVKGLQMGGMEIVSITDTTPTPTTGTRPRKRRRI